MKYSIILTRTDDEGNVFETIERKLDYPTFFQIKVIVE